MHEVNNNYNSKFYKATNVFKVYETTAGSLAQSCSSQYEYFPSLFNLSEFFSDVAGRNFYHLELPQVHVEEYATKPVPEPKNIASPAERDVEIA